MLARQVIERAEHSLLIAEEAIANPLLGNQPIGGLLHLAECGVHAKERQQSDGDQSGETSVTIVDLALIFGHQLPDAQFAAGQRQDQDRRDQGPHEAEGEQRQGQPGADVAGDHRHRTVSSLPSQPSR